MKPPSNVPLSPVRIEFEKGHREDPYDRSIIYFQKDVIALIYSLQSFHSSFPLPLLFLIFCFLRSFLLVFIFVSLVTLLLFPFFRSTLFYFILFLFIYFFFFSLPKYTRIIYRRAHPENYMVETYFLSFFSSSSSSSSLTKPVNEWLFHR